MKRILPLFAAVALISCGNDETQKPAQDSVPAAVQARTTISDIQNFRPNIDLTPWDGDLYDAIYWVDARGENAVLISGRPQHFWADENPDAKSFFPKGEDKETLSELTEFYAAHFVMKKGETKWTVYNTYHDFLFGCCDVYMGYQPASLQVMDADSNGTGEYMFMYHQTEGDGMISHTFTGTLVLELDSVYYAIRDETGLGIEILRSGTPDYKSAGAATNFPDNVAYTNVMRSKWDELYNLKVEQDRAEVTEQNNVDDHGHADHVH